jgi:hypothetical protein
MVLGPSFTDGTGVALTTAPSVHSTEAASAPGACRADTWFTFGTISISRMILTGVDSDLVSSP